MIPTSNKVLQLQTFLSLLNILIKYVYVSVFRWLLNFTLPCTVYIKLTFTLMLISNLLSFKFQIKIYFVWNDNIFCLFIEMYNEGISDSLHINANWITGTLGHWKTCNEYKAPSVIYVIASALCNLNKSMQAFNIFFSYFL